MEAKYTPHQKRYYAEQLLLHRPARELEAITSSMSGAKVDLNPHQVEAARFALKSPISNGVLLADEVGLGKTIEAGLVLTQFWAEHKNSILIILPASLRIQWKTELEEKFGLPSIIIERPKKRKGVIPHKNPFRQATEDKIITICSLEYADKCRDLISVVPWDLVVIDEAHRLRNVYKGMKRATNIKEALNGRKKLLLTATPLQNDLKEMYGLVSIIDDHIFGNVKAFSASNADIADIKARLRNLCKRTLRQDVNILINFPERYVYTQDYTPSDKEQRLYDMVSKYLQDDTIKALPEKGRNLVIMVARKLLASSTFAISKTLGVFENKLKKLIEEYDGEIVADIDEDLKEDIAEDFDTIDSYEDELEDDEGDAAVINVDLENDKKKAEAEIAYLQEMRKLADSIDTNAKGENLLMALDEGFKMVEQHKGKGARKAVIFTESTRTQNYILDTLNKGGYKGQVVLLNGSNSDSDSKRIYAEWKERHKDDGVLSLSKDANMKAAIVEEFRSDRTSILIGTEAAAEGINLQFCNMVVNYDLPWNPQRVEQRIGRCHRYGQKHDVVVVNFLNTKNAADKRVYELLEKKFKLFEGVLGASNAPISVIETGGNFSRDILAIYQKCRDDTEIEAAFDKLQKKYEEAIMSEKKEAIQLIFDTFSEDVISQLKECENMTKASLDEFSRYKFNLFTAYGAKRADGVGWAFVYEGKRYIPSWDTAKDCTDDSIFLTADAEFYTNLLAVAKNEETPTAKIRFHYAPTAASDAISVLTQNPGLTGGVSICKLIYTYGMPDGKSERDFEEHLLITIMTDNGINIDKKDFNRIMELQAEIIGMAALDDKLEATTKKQYEAEKVKIENFSKEALLNRFSDLNAWSMDRETALDRDIDELRKELSCKRGQMEARVADYTFNEIREMQKEIMRLDSEIDRKQRQKLEDKDTIKKEALREQNAALAKLNGEFRLEPVMSFTFEIEEASNSYDSSIKTEE